MKMDEAERASRYEAEGVTGDEWGEPETLRRPRRRLGSMFSVRLTAKEAELVRHAADERGLTVSAYLRACALRSAVQENNTTLGVTANAVFTVAPAGVATSVGGIVPAA
jgi:hypothetical protein